MSPSLRATCSSPSIASIAGLGLMLALNMAPHMNEGRSCLHFLVALATTLLAVAALYRVRPRGTRAFAWAPVPCGALVCGGLVADSLGLAGTPHAVLAVASGIGMAYLSCRWFWALCALPRRSAPAQLLAAFSFAGLARFGAMSLFDISPAAATALLGVFACASTALLLHVEQSLRPRDLPCPVPGKREAANRSAVDKSSRIRRAAGIGIELTLYGLLFGLLRTDLLEWSFSTNTRIPGQAVQIVLPALLLGFIAVSRRRKVSSRAIRAAVLTVVVILLAVIFFVDAVDATVSVGMFVIRCMISILIYLRLFEAVFDLDVHPAVAFGLGRGWFGVLFTAGLAGYDSLIAHGALGALPHNVVFFAMSVIALLLLNSFSGTALLHHADAASEAARSDAPTLTARCSEAAELFCLSERETQVLRLISDGLSKREIAEKLCLSEDTVRYHAKQLYRKMGVHSKQELMLALFEPSRKGRDPVP